jgi:GNAT superfamily N-acetyltransferase
MMLEEDTLEEEFARFDGRDGFDYRIVGYFDLGVVSLDLIHKEKTYGKALGALHEDRTLLLGNIMIDERPRRPIGLSWLERWCPRPGGQGVGLGSQLLDTLIEVARARQVRWIDAGVIDDDLEHSPFLLDWYRNRGFKLLPLGALKGVPGQGIRLMLE